MSHTLYTPNYLIRNPNEVLKNTRIGLYDNTDSQNNKQIKSLYGFTPEDRSGNQAQSRRLELIVAGFINLHGHLAYSNIELKSQALFAWLKALLGQTLEGNPPANPSIHRPNSDKLDSKLQDSPEFLACLTGAQEALSYGTTYFVDNTSGPETSAAACLKAGLRALIGLEVFGSEPARAEEIFARCSERLQSLQSNDLIDFCFSPHASYDVSPKLWSLLSQHSQEHDLLTLSHVGESAAEEAWFRDKDSQEAQSAREFWQSINTLEPKLSQWQPHKGSVDYLHSNSMLQGQQLFAHGVHLNREALEVLKEHNVSLVTCPRSNLFLENGLPDYQTWFDLDLDFGVGTDSKASNYDLDLRKEVNSIPGLTSKQKLELLTTKPAKILGKQDQLGQLDAGYLADYTVFEVQLDEIASASPRNDLIASTTSHCEAEPKQSQILDLLFDTEATKVKEVYINGECKYSSC